jgi:hypothetical protein
MEISPAGGYDPRLIGSADATPKYKRHTSNRTAQIVAVRRAFRRSDSVFYQTL